MPPGLTTTPAAFCRRGRRRHPCGRSAASLRHHQRTFMKTPPQAQLLPRHVGLAVAYNAWQYYATTADLTWLAECGGELIVEVARMFSSLARYDPVDERYHIDGVMGPDEYHDGYPDARGLGIAGQRLYEREAAWVCGRALEVTQLLRGQPCD